MGDRWYDPLRGSDRADDDGRDKQPGERTGSGDDRDRPDRELERNDRPERELDQGDRPDGASAPGAGGTLDRAEERAATDDASLRERLSAGTRRTGELAAAALVSASSILGWQKTDDRLPVQAAAEAAEVFEATASAGKRRKDRENAVAEPNRELDPQEQLPPDREGDRPAADRTDGDGPAGTPSVEVDLPGRGPAGELGPDATDDD